MFGNIPEDVMERCMSEGISIWTHLFLLGVPAAILVAALLHFVLRGRRHVG
jgi:hypothetical protein